MRMGIDEAGGFVYVCDHDFSITFGNNRVQKFDADGNFILKRGTTGAGNGQFQEPNGISANGDGIFVLDSFNRRVQLFDAAGTGAYQDQFGSSGSGDGQFMNPTGISTGFDNGISEAWIFVTDPNGGGHTVSRVQQFGPLPLTPPFLRKYGTYNDPPGDSEFIDPVGVTGAGEWVYVLDANGTGTPDYNSTMQVFGANSGAHLFTFQI